MVVGLRAICEKSKPDLIGVPTTGLAGSRSRRDESSDLSAEIRRMIEVQACVPAFGRGFEWLQTTRKSACGACSASSGCGTAIVDRLFGKRVNRLQVSDDTGLKAATQW
jgi:hypothetical protein